ncbi:cytochrome-c peroxidase [Paucibacter sp. Y2R2-4]|uniref:cytochrome-c peroxidase n=1 Tax=Paucibacter sp. Y2R2-4 TaxID=2893553 RepID=UPI0021E4474F|nr:cytochrome c peroxidase [Paucibacter sp. Y2R2-4]MCV2350586.1 cytochrome-c peroxidase [Paucibacter sp. Y2R2-4]
MRSATHRLELCWARLAWAAGGPAAIALMMSACGGGGAGGAGPSAAANAASSPPPPTSPTPPASAASSPVPPSPPASSPVLSAKALLGEKIFHDAGLSGSGRMSCASCHDPAFFHGPPNSLPVQKGGRLNTEFGLRAAPSLRYLERLGAFSGTTNTPVADLRGGLMADGRADNLAAQALLPWFNPREMDNGTPADLARKLRATSYAAEFARVFVPAAGADAPDDATLVAQASQALQSFQLEDARFHPYDAKFDWVQQGRAQFTAPEARGLAVFNDPKRGNCAACHPSTSADGRPPVFTTFGYAALGVPRNTKIPANADAAAFDLGLCQSPRPELKDRQDSCGFFRIPTLRNTVQRPVFFHNGQFSNLETVLLFYQLRDADSAFFYPSVANRVQLYDDLPAALRGNVNRDAPFSARPLTNEAEQADLLCFLRTLTDGYSAGSPTSAGCS